MDDHITEAIKSTTMLFVEEFETDSSPQMRLAMTRARAAAKYKPDRTKLLFVAESPPLSPERYFYFEDVPTNDWLWIALMKALYPSEWQSPRQERPRKAQWLTRFKASGFWLIDVVKDPLGGSDKKRIADMTSALPALIAEVREIAPKQVILIKATVHRAVYHALRGAGISVANATLLPFPSNRQQKRFENEFRKLLAALKDEIFK